jgi:hypothetical protein
MSANLRLLVLGALGVAPLTACVEESKDDDDDAGSGGGTGGGASFVDNDGDGWHADKDCDDTNPEIHPGAEEWCNGEDDDCDAEVDEGMDTALLWVDADQDGFGAGEPIESCEWVEGHAWTDGDCDDTNPYINPYAEEVCDGVDNNCDGADDLGTVYIDADGDGYGGTADTWDVCDDLPAGTSLYAQDCDDGDDAVHPGAAEVCWDATDNDCDGYLSCFQTTTTDGDAACDATWEATWLQTSSESACETCSFGVDTYFQLVSELVTTETCGELTELYPYLSFDNGVMVTDLADGWTIEEQGWADGIFHLELRGESDGGDGETVVEVQRLELRASEIQTYYYYYEGRPFTVEGRARFAIPTEGAAWRGDAFPQGPAPTVAGRIARVWTAAGRAEHASVASFARFSLELMALGAPAELLLGASQAMADEVAHAKACFAVAASAGALVGDVGPLDVSGSLDAAGDPAATLVALIREGCVGETVSALRAERALAGATVPAVRTALATITVDEGRHAAYAWRCVRWLLGAHPELVPLAQETFAAATPGGQAEPEADPSADALALWGVLDARARHRAEADAWRVVIHPAVGALLG